MRLTFLFLLITISFAACSGEKRNPSKEELINIPTNSKDFGVDDSRQEVSFGSFKIKEIQKNRARIKLGHGINTAADEYMPVPDVVGNRLYFAGMDRTGFFDFKLDFIKQKSSGGEDIFYSDLTEGVWTDARPLNTMNTNSHEVVSQVLPNGDLLVTANYPEKLGANATGDAGMQTTDLFYLRNLESDYQIIHFPEPVNSIFTEADPWMAKDKSYLLFVSDREGHVGEYHKKGWKWNDSFWGNTDVYVSQKVGDSWSVPQNLGSLVNTPGAERTPWMSEDGLTLYLSSNGYQPGKTDLDVYAFKRKNSNSWTEWDGPYAITDANTAYDDWGYKEVKSGEAFLASAAPRGFKPTQGGKSGDGGFRETNFRPGYELFGLQVAALNAEFDTNIFQLKKSDSPVFILQDVFFDFNSFRINKKFEEYLTLMADQLALNPEVVIQIEGYTDNVGAAHYNLELSLNRADAVKAFLIRKGVTQEIQTFGFGADRPITDNANALNRGKNRRVEIYLK